MKEGYVNTKEAHCEDTGNSNAVQGMPGGEKAAKIPSSHIPEGS